MDSDTRRLDVLKDAFFRRLLVPDAGVQQQFAAALAQDLTAMIEARDPLMEAYYPTLVRYAQQAPFRPIRETLTHVRASAEAQWPELRALVRPTPAVSYFVPNSQLVDLASTEDPTLVNLTRNAFVRGGRISHLLQLLAWHPTYLDLEQSTLACVMVQDGSLPPHWRSYIALMASAELRGHYLAELQQYNFVVNGGDLEWIKGIDYISPKLFKLHELSSLVAHRPWMITPQHIGALLSPDQEDTWSVSEVVHAIIILCQYVAMACMSQALGCADEEDLAVFSGHAAMAAERQAIAEIQEAETLRNRMQQLAVDESRGNETKQETTSQTSAEDLASIERDDTLLLKRLRNGNEGSETADDEDDDGEDENQVDFGGQGSFADEEDPVMDGVFEIAENDTGYNIHTDASYRRRDTLWRFCGGLVLRYADFDVRSDDYDVLHTEDFSWEEHGFPLVRRYFPGEAGQILEEQFNLASKLTYDYFGSHQEEDIDTSPYRGAIWYYVHRLFGICHDDYDYRQVNDFLNRPTKIFIKKVACTPWKVTASDFEHFDHELSASEKCHVVILVAEARKQACLMYALRAVMKHMQ